MSTFDLKNNIFTTYGTLRASVLEVIDVSDPFQSTINKNKPNRSKLTVYAIVSVVDENAAASVHPLFSTAPRPYFHGEPMIIGEEFIFENVSSLHSLVVSLYSLASGKVVSQNDQMKVPVCVGTTKIPLARLEENIPGKNCLS